MNLITMGNFKITGIHHIKLTVSDLDRSKSFYLKLPGFKLVAEHPGFIMFYTGSFYLGLTDHQGKLDQKNFNEKNVGMDHVAFQVGSYEDLEKAIIFLKEQNIPHGKIEKLSNGTQIVVFRDPDNIQLEIAFK